MSETEKGGARRSITEIARELAAKAGRRQSLTAMEFCIQECVEADRAEVREGLSRTLVAVGMAQAFYERTGVQVRPDTMATNRRRLDERLGLRPAERVARLEARPSKSGEAVRSLADLERLLGVDASADTEQLGDMGFDPSGPAARFLRGRRRSNELVSAGPTVVQTTRSAGGASKAPKAARQADARQAESPVPSRVQSVVGAGSIVGTSGATVTTTNQAVAPQAVEQAGLFPTPDDDVDAEMAAIRERNAR